MKIDPLDHMCCGGDAEEKLLEIILKEAHNPGDVKIVSCKRRTAHYRFK